MKSSNKNALNMLYWPKPKKSYSITQERGEAHNTFGISIFSLEKLARSRGCNKTKGKNTGMWKKETTYTSTIL